MDDQVIAAQRIIEQFKITGKELAAVYELLRIAMPLALCALQSGHDTLSDHSWFWNRVFEMKKSLEGRYDFLNEDATDVSGDFMNYVAEISYSPDSPPETHP